MLKSLHNNLLRLLRHYCGSGCSSMQAKVISLTLLSRRIIINLGCNFYLPTSRQHHSSFYTLVCLNELKGENETLRGKRLLFISYRVKAIFFSFSKMRVSAHTFEVNHLFSIPKAMILNKQSQCTTIKTNTIWCAGEKHISLFKFFVKEVLISHQ